MKIKKGVYVKKPYLQWFNDYHDIDEKEERSKNRGGKLKTSEINTEDFGYYYDGPDGGYMYLGLVYTGVKPSKKEIRTMLVKKLKGTYWTKIDNRRRPEKIYDNNVVHDSDIIVI